MKHLTTLLAATILLSTTASAHDNKKCSCPKKKAHHSKSAARVRTTNTTVRTAPAPTSVSYGETRTYAGNTSAKDLRKSGSSHISLGPVLGLGGSAVSNTVGDRGFKFSPALGIGMVYSTNENFGIGLQLLISHEGYESEYTTPSGSREEMTVNPVYLRMPLQFTYFFGEYGDRVRPKIYAGPSVAVKVDEVHHFSSSDRPFEGNFSEGNQFNRFDAGLTGGIGINFRVGNNMWLNTDLGYYHGLVDVLDDNVNSDFNGNRNLRVNVGLMWGL